MREMTKVAQDGAPAVEAEAPSYVDLQYEPPPEMPDSTPDCVADEQQAGGVSAPTVIERLENMRTAIASLIEEVTERTERRIPPRS